MAFISPCFFHFVLFFGFIFRFLARFSLQNLHFSQKSCTFARFFNNKIVEQIYTGKISFLLHPEIDGFITYINSDGESARVYFCKKSNFFKPKHQIWQLSDKVTFSIIQKEDGKICAKVFEFLGNDDFNSLTNKAGNSTKIQLRGTLKVIDHLLYLSEQEYNLLFQVRNLMPTDIAFTPDDVFEAELDLERSKKMVSLAIYEQYKIAFANFLQTSQPLLAPIEKVNFDYLLISLPNTPLKGKVTSFERSKEYAIGDYIEVVPFSVGNYGFSFAMSGYQDEQTPFEKGTLYTAKIVAFRSKGYIVEIVGTEAVGVLDFKHKEDVEPFEKDQLVNLYYIKRNNSQQFAFATEKQFAELQEKQAKSSL